MKVLITTAYRGKIVLKWVLALMAILILVVALTGFLLYCALFLPPVQSKVVDWFQVAIEKNIGRSITVGSVSTNLFTSTTIRNIRVSMPEKTTDSINIGSARLEYVLPFLFVKRLFLKQIELKDVTSSVTLDSSGNYLLLDEIRREIALHRKPGKGMLDVTINKLKINGLQGTFLDNSRHQTAFVQNASLHGSFHHKKGLSLSLRIHGGQYTSNWWYGDISVINADVVFQKNGLKVSQLLIQADQSKLLGKGFIPFTGDGEWDLSVSTSTRTDALPVLLNVIPHLSRKGYLSADASWTGTMQHPVLKADIEGSDIKYDTFDADSISVSARYGIDDTVKTHFSASGPAGSVSGSGLIVIENLMSPLIVLGQYSATVRLNHIKPDSIQSIAPHLASSITGMECSGAITLEGSGIKSAPKDISLFAYASGCRFFADTLKVSAVISDTLWNVSSHFGENSLFAQGSIADFRTINGSVSVLIPTPDLFTRNFIDDSTSGLLRIFADISGPLQFPDVSLSCYCINGLWRGCYIDSSMIRMKITPQQQFINTLYARMHSNAGVLAQFIGKKAQGDVHVSITGEGELFHPNASAQLSITDLSMENAVIDTVKVTVSMNRLDSIILHQGTLISSSSGTMASISGTGSLQQKSLALKGIFERLDPESKRKLHDTIGTVSVDAQVIGMDSIILSYEIDTLTLDQLSSNFAKQGIAGAVSIAGTCQGSIGNPNCATEISVHDFKYREFAVDNVVVRLNLVDSLLGIDGALFSETADTISIAASIPLLPHKKWSVDTSGIRPVSFTCSAEKLPLKRMVVYSDSGFTVSGSAAIALHGSLQNNKLMLNGMVDISHAGFVSSVHKIRVSEIAVNMIVSGSIDTPEVSFRCDAGPVELKGGVIRKISALGVADRHAVNLYSVKISLPDSGTVLVDGIIPLEKGKTKNAEEMALNFSILSLPFPLVTSMLPENYVHDGVIQGKGAFRTVNGKPEVRGSISLDNGLIVTENINPSIGPVNASVKLAGDSVIIEKISARWGKGKIASHGTIILNDSGFPSVDVKINADNLAWTTPDVMYGAVDNAVLHCTNQGDTIVVTGNVNLGSTRYIQDVQITDIISRLQNESVRKDVGTQGTFADRIALNVNVDLQENAGIDINLGSLKLDGNCILSGTVAKPSFIGDLNVVDGHILYLDRQFEISQAQLSNYDPKELVPVINLEATADILSMNGDQTENYTILLTLKGDLKSPVFTLKDETGSLNELEIISILTLGQPLGGMSGDMRERLTAFVSQSLLGFGSRKLEQFLGIEKIDVKGDIFDGKQVAENTRLTIAKRVTPRLMVLYESDIGKRNRPKISALYRLANNIFLSGETDNDGQSGVDIIFKYSK